jgi:neutral ceramidase
VLAGIGTGVITPTPPVMLAGFGARAAPATEVHDDLEVRVLYLRAERSAVALAVCDLLGMSLTFALAVRHAVAEELGLPVAAVLTACTHTHSAPSCIAGSEAIGWPTPPGYADLLVAGARAAAAAAIAGASPARLSCARAPLPPGLSVNRRGHPYEPWFALLDLRHPDGARIGTLANLSVHPVALGPECRAVSSDWVGPFRKALERRLGGTALMLSGALGDVNPRHVHRQGNECPSDDGFAEAAELGEELAEAVSGAIPGALPLEESVEMLRCERVELPVGDTMLARLGPAGGSERAEVELVEWSVGGARLVSIPGEGFHALGNAVARARSGPVLLAGLAPVWQGYLPVPFTEGYEESMSLGEPFVTALVAELVRTEAVQPIDGAPCS